MNFFGGWAEAFGVFLGWEVLAEGAENCVITNGGGIKGNPITIK